MELKIKKFIFSCQYCNKLFKSLKKRNRKYCSQKCFCKSRIGKKLTQEHRNKIKQGNIGKIVTKETRIRMSIAQKALNKKLSIETKRKISITLKIVQKGHKVSKETKKKISNSLKGHSTSQETRNKLSKKSKGKNNPNYGNHKLAGINHWNWQGGSSIKSYPLEFNNELKEQIKARDNYTCQKCGMTEEEHKRRLPVHHIDYDKQNCNSLNLITLCQSCHVKTNYNRKYCIVYFKTKMENKVCVSV